MPITCPQNMPKLSFKFKFTKLLRCSGYVHTAYRTRHKIFTLAISGLFQNYGVWVYKSCKPFNNHYYKVLWYCNQCSQACIMFIRYSQTCLSDHLYIATTCTSDHLFLSTPLRFPYIIYLYIETTCP
jgi:hypothetical protein